MGGLMEEGSGGNLQSHGFVFSVVGPPICLHFDYTFEKLVECPFNLPRFTYLSSSLPDPLGTWSRPRWAARSLCLGCRSLNLQGSPSWVSWTPSPWLRRSRQSLMMMRCPALLPGPRNLHLRCEGRQICFCVSSKLLEVSLPSPSSS